MSTAPAATGHPAFVELLRSEEDKLLGCVHCGFCLPVCPTYTRLGDEADSPRGRLYLMRALVEGRIDAGSDAYQTHIDRCLGCRACETVCPSGVQYGQLLEGARAAAIGAKPLPARTRLLLRVFASPALRGPLLLGARLVRALGLAALAARLPAWGFARSARLGAAMLAGSAAVRLPKRARARGPSVSDSSATRSGPRSIGGLPAGEARPTVAILLGCVQRDLFSRVNDATERTLAANGCSVTSVPSQGCCGALHAHAGDIETARGLARRNIDAFERAAPDLIVANAAGCGAAMRDYGHLLGDDPDYGDRAAAFSARVRDVTEVLVERGPAPAGPLRLRVTYDAPCHLHHAQGVTRAPLDVLSAIEGLEIVPLRGADECCGGAGIYAITHPELGGRIGDDKLAAVEATGAEVVATGNPGCMMQIGAGLRLRGSGAQVAHPVELLDEGYRIAGYY